jgi:hypothetical protein
MRRQRIISRFAPSRQALHLKYTFIVNRTANPDRAGDASISIDRTLLW